VTLAAQLARWHFPLIDCQMQTEHLSRLGATNITRRQFVTQVRRLVQQPQKPSPWQLDHDLMAMFR
jgi:leucyl/phenylalanyl-tRNA--protein transferase